MESELVAMTRVSVRAVSMGDYLGAPTNEPAFSIAYGLSAKAWQAAALHRADTTGGPPADEEMNGVFEIHAGETVVLSEKCANVLLAACQLARARGGGFPYEQPDCVVEDPEGGWTLQLHHEPASRLISLTEMHDWVTGAAPAATVVATIDAFLKRFAGDAASRIPDLTGWSGLDVLGAYLPAPRS